MPPRCSPHLPLWVMSPTHGPHKTRHTGLVFLFVVVVVFGPGNAKSGSSGSSSSSSSGGSSSSSSDLSPNPLPAHALTRPLACPPTRAGGGRRGLRARRRGPRSNVRGKTQHPPSSICTTTKHCTTTAHFIRAEIHRKLLLGICDCTRAIGDWRLAMVVEQPGRSLAIANHAIATASDGAGKQRPSKRPQLPP